MVGSLPEEECVRATSCEELVDMLSPADPVVRGFWVRFE